MDKTQMREELKLFRARNSKHFVKNSLQKIPFENSSELFNVFKLPTTHLYPCHVFGKQLTLKIVDELLDEGGD